MNRVLITQAIHTIGYYAAVCGEDDQDTPAKQTIKALKAELEKPEPEPYGYVSEHRWLIGDNSLEFHFKLETIYLNNCTSITPVYTKGTQNA